MELEEGAIKKETGSRNLTILRPYVPEEFADFSVYNAGLENREWITSKMDFACSFSLDKEVSRSPTTSSVTSGYFSHSASNATLSDIVVPSSESMDQLVPQSRDVETYELTGHQVAQNCISCVHKRLTEGNCTENTTNLSAFTEKSAFNKVPYCTTENAAAMCRSVSSSSVDSNKGTFVKFFPCEVAVEHTCDILEDHSFTEFMGVEEGKDFEHHEDLPTCSSNGGKDGVVFVDLSEHVCNMSEQSVSEQTDQKSVCLGEAALFNKTQTESDTLARNNLVVSDDYEDTSELSCHFSLGDQVCIGDNKYGIVRYVGAVDFSCGVWIGVELHIQLGK